MIINKRISKLIKSHFADKVFNVEESYFRCDYKINVVVPNKPTDKVKINVDVINMERKRIMRDGNNHPVREGGEYVYEWVKKYPSKLNSHRHNHSLRTAARSHMIFKVFGLGYWELEVKTVKWS